MFYKKYTSREMIHVWYVHIWEIPDTYMRNELLRVDDCSSFYHMFSKLYENKNGNNLFFFKQTDFKLCLCMLKGIVALHNILL